MINWSAWVEQEYTVYPLTAGRKTRWIEAPSHELKELQRDILDKLLYKLEPTEFSHGFLPDRSIVSNAQAHVGREWVVTADIKDFFPSITSAQVTTVLAELHLSPERQHIITELVTRKGRLPQGAPTSPHLSNLVVRGLDRELGSLGWTYTRYADDLTFSGDGDTQDLLFKATQRVRRHGFKLAPKKTRVMPRHQRQVVTGLTVNEKVSVPKPLRRKLRAMIHNIDNGPASEHQLQVANGRLSLARFVEGLIEV
tara:strand:+ start:2983 stop:3744 length:762 start_codon:yes stop_codon:yes gene_type:complete